MAAAGRGHCPVLARLPGLLWGPAPEPPTPTAGEGGKMGGKGLQDVGRGHWGQESRAGGWWGMQVFLEEPGDGVPHPQYVLPSTPHLVSFNLELRRFIKPPSRVNSF